MRLRCLHGPLILSDHNFIDRLINNLGVIGHHRPIAHACVSFVNIIYPIITGFGLTGFDCDSRETLIYRPGRLKPAVGIQRSDALPGLGAFTSTLIKYTPCLSTERIL